MSKLRVLDLFTGAGGFSLGLESTGGFESVAFCEVDKHKREILAKNWPEVHCHDDIRTMRGQPCDIITGGFPCQDISTAGSGGGLDGERSGLWFEMLRVIGESGPRYVVVENSPNLLSGNDGRWMGAVLAGLASVGYDAEWHVIPLAATGAPHLRERLFIIAYADGVRQSGQGQLLKSIYSAPDAYREADRLVDAFQGNALPFVCGCHDGVPARMASQELHSYGNAVGPEIASQIGHAILALEASK
ncbi:cytosine DNA methylase [Sulfitobacter phage phiGT1]|nr:cytosine DNA methylase [Sulfitobacter phage phiGT1]